MVGLKVLLAPLTNSIVHFVCASRYALLHFIDIFDFFSPILSTHSLPFHLSAIEREREKNECDPKMYPNKSK